MKVYQEEYECGKGSEKKDECSNELKWSDLGLVTCRGALCLFLMSVFCDEFLCHTQSLCF